MFGSLHAVGLIQGQITFSVQSNHARVHLEPPCSEGLRPVVRVKTLCNCVEKTQKFISNRLYAAGVAHPLYKQLLHKKQPLFIIYYKYMYININM